MREKIILTNRRNGWSIEKGGKFISNLATDEVLFAVACVLIADKGAYGGLKTPKELHEWRRAWRKRIRESRELFND